ncbi:MAG: apolipoprotein N-acyltransferase [Actinobacteria bacterium]|nr:apolipoprotein N-acyltransferase [Actinomycetota bacterium]
MVWFGALVSAGLLWLAFPPVGWGAIVFIAPVPLLWGLRRAKGRWSAAGATYLFGIVFFTSLLWWVAISTRVGAAVLFPVMGLYLVPLGWIVWRTRAWAPGLWWMVVVGGWAATEWVRGHWPFGGFPWGSLGTAVGDVPALRATAQWVGETGLSVLAVGIAAGLVLVLERKSARWLAGAVGTALVLLLAGSLWPPQTDGNVLRVAVIQGSSPCPGRYCPGENQEIFDSHLALTRTLEAGSVDLVIWPESSAQYGAETLTNPQNGEAVAAEAVRLDASILVGSTRAVGDTGFVNANVLYGPDGVVVGEYRKRQGVPFGEYVPFRRYLGWVKEIDRVSRDMVPGTHPVVWDLPQGPFASVICFEAAFPRHVREAVRAGARFVVVTTNESGYGRSAATLQFSEMTRMRAAENGIDMVHASITGSSALITADGTITDRTPIMEPAILRGEVGFRTLGPTLYNRVGDWVQLLAIAGFLAAVGLGVWRERVG